MKSILGALMVLVLVASVAVAQVEKGDREIQGSGYLFAVSGVTMLSINGLFGYYYTEQIEIGGGPTFQYLHASGLDDATLGVTLFGKYHFPAVQKLVPYVGGQLYQYDIAPEDPVSFIDCTYLQASAGFKYFVRPHFAYDVSGNLGFGPGSGDACFFLMAGVSAFF